MIECVPNISDGRNRAVVDQLASAITSVGDVYLLHRSSDADHHRSVFTYASESAPALAEATLALFEVAIREIDLRQHQGEHPRAGAIDVVPFVPLAGRDMSDCVALARQTGQVVADRFQLPVYLYEEAAGEDYRRPLPEIRRGGFERFGEKILDPRWAPDFGPPRVHPSAGVTVIGARVPLIAFNVQLASRQLDVAQKVARAVRASSGGLPFVRAIPIMLARRGVVQVSMNLLDYRRTSLRQAFECVRDEAGRHGVEVLSSEIIGLVPQDALDPTAPSDLRIENFDPGIVLETRLEEAMKGSNRKT